MAYRAKSLHSSDQTWDMATLLIFSCAEYAVFLYTKFPDFRGGERGRDMCWEGVKTYIFLLLPPTKKCEFRLTNRWRMSAGIVCSSTPVLVPLFRACTSERSGSLFSSPHSHSGSSGKHFQLEGPKAVIAEQWIKNNRTPLSECGRQGYLTNLELEDNSQRHLRLREETWRSILQRWFIWSHYNRRTVHICNIHKAQTMHLEWYARRGTSRWL